MRKTRRIRRILCTAAAVLLAAPAAAAEDAVLKEKVLELGLSRISYPAAEGLADENRTDRVNALLTADLGTEEYIARTTALISDESLRVETEWDGLAAGDVISCAMSAEGALESARSTHRWTWSNIDLRDMHEITLDELFTDGEAARGWLEEYLEYEVEPEMSAHLSACETVPLPEGFRLERTGLTLLYPVSRLSTLSDRAGAVKIGWNEIRDLLDPDADGIPARIGVPEMTELDGESAERIREMTESGRLPDIPVQVGDALKPLTDRYGLLTDPDIYEGGRIFAPEGACFRDVYLLTDYMSEEWDDSVVRGIRMDRGCAWGLCVGETRRDEWRAVLGAPDAEAELDEERAEAYRTEPGACDYYTFGSYQLRLYCDREDVLTGIVLTE